MLWKLKIIKYVKRTTTTQNQDIETTTRRLKIKNQYILIKNESGFKKVGNLPQKYDYNKQYIDVNKHCMILVNLWDQILGKSIKTGKFENVNLVNILFFPMFSFSSFSTNFAKLLIAQNALQREWGNFPFANWNGIFWGLPLQHV